MKLSQRGIDLIKQFEGYRSKAYPDPATGGAPWTIGYGTTVYPSGEKVAKGDTITPNHAEYCLRNDVAKFESGVDEHAAWLNVMGELKSIYNGDKK